MGYTEKIEKHDNYPNVLGETTFGSIKAACPPLTLREVGANAVTFEPLEVAMFDVTLTALGVYSGLPQEVVVVDNGSNENAWAEKRNPAEVTIVETFGWSDYIPPGSYSAKVHVDAETAGQILHLEREHKEDAEYAYAQTIEHLAACVGTLTSQTFTGDDGTAARRAAFQALAAAVGPRFVPAYPMVPENWSELARVHCRELRDRSKTRDTEGAHRASWTVRLAETGVLHLMPVIPQRGLAPSELLTLDDLPVASPAWDTETLPTCPFTIGQDVEVTTELIIPDGESVPVGWRGTFDTDLSDASGTKFVFVVHPQDDEDTTRRVTVPPSQLAGLRAAVRATVQVSYTNPFAVNDIVKATSTISTSSGEIPPGAIGQFYADNTDDTGAQLLFDFPGVRATNGYPMDALIAPADLRLLERCTDPLPVPLLPKVLPKADEDDDGSPADSAEESPDESSDGEEDPDVASAFELDGAVARLASSLGPLTGETQDTLTATIAEGLRAARDAAREKTT